VVIAPSADDDAIALFAKKKNLRLLIVGDLPNPAAPSLTQRNVAGGILDAFFPFADGMLAAASAGATAIIQPGGSIRDDEVIKAADEQGIAMVFTGMRHFRH